jgi:hypothetical protein
MISRAYFATKFVYFIKFLLLSTNCKGYEIANLGGKDMDAEDASSKGIMELSADLLFFALFFGSPLQCQK